MSQTNDCEPFIIHTVLIPTADSSFIHKLILAYSQQLSSQNPQFQLLFKQKQDKLSRHSDQLKLLNEMKEDPLLRQQVLQQIELKDYEKEYQALIGSVSYGQTYQGPLSLRLKASNKQHRSFHLPNHQPKSKENSIPFSKPQQKSSFAKEQSTKKFRSSLIKSGSFSSINKKKGPFGNQTNILEKSLRNSENGCSFVHDKNFSNGSILKKKAIINLEHENSQTKKGFIKSKEIVQNSIFEKSQQEKCQQNEEKQPNEFDDEEAEIKEDQNELFIQQKLPNLEKNEESNTKRTHLKTTSNKLPQIQVKQNSVRKSQDTGKDTGRSVNKSYSKENKQSPYQISNFLRQLNSYHYVSQYNQLKNPMKRNHVKRE